MEKTTTSEKVKEQTKEKELRNIYAKMASVKTKLLGIKKGGKNDFSHYNYFELGDILPVLTPALEEERLYMKTQFSATEQIAKLIIIDIDEPENQIDFEIRFAECALKGAHEIQNLGAAQTYTRRYLIMTAFDVAEADIVDAGAEKDEKKEAQRKAEQEKAKQPPAPKPQQTTPAKPQQAQQQETKDINGLRRETWDLIKRLSKEEQAKWINSCKGASIELLEEIIFEVEAILNSCIEAHETASQEMAAEDQPAAEQQNKVKSEELEIF